MSHRRRDHTFALGLAAVSFALAFLQRQGWASSDTKIDLHVQAARFLGEVASVWSSSGGLGQVQAGQYSGYLFPMGPFFALGDLLGVAPWVVHRLWLGTLLAIAQYLQLVLGLSPLEAGLWTLPSVIAYLGASFNPFAPEDDPNQDGFRVRNLKLPGKVDLARLGSPLLEP